MVREFLEPPAPPPPLSRDECRAIIQSKCGFSDPAAVWVAIETHKYADDLYRKLAGAMQKG